MKIRTDVAAMLRDGATTTETMTALRVGHRAVVQAREALGIPAPARGGRPLPPLTDQFDSRTEPVEGGHLRWTGYVRKGIPILGRSGGNLSAFRIAFELKHGRNPVGQIRSTCGYPGCVAPEHMQDRPMREQLDAQYAAIFGPAT